MKKKWLGLLTLLCAGSMALGFAACGEKENSSSTGSGEHEHVFGEWSQTELAHVKVCACGEEVEEVHTHDDKGQCTVCGVWEGTDGLSYNLLRVDDEYVYEVAGKGIATETDIVIPSFYDGKRVTSIGSHAFDEAETSYALTSIVIPDGVTDVREYAFRNCGELTDIIIPKTVVTIGANAFADCNKLKIVTIEDDSQLTTINECAFYQCMLLESVVFGKNSRLTTIGERAFYRCNQLVNITLPASVTFQGKDAFFKDSNGGNDGGNDGGNNGGNDGGNDGGNNGGNDETSGWTGFH